MKIGIITKHNCIRVTKQALPLMDAGHELHLFTNDMNFTDFYKTVNYYEGYGRLKNSVEQFPDIDIWHIHNEPSYMAVVVRNVFPKAKIVLDMHDSNYLRFPEDHQINGNEKVVWYEEDLSIDAADEIVVPSHEMGRLLKKRTGIKPTFIPSACPRSSFRVSMNKIRGGLISQGGHDLPGVDELGNWREYTDIYKQLNYRRKLHIACPQFNFNKGDRLRDHYEKYGELVKLPYPQLIEFITTCSWNLVGNTKGHVWNNALPNKFFDAVAAGTPSVVFNCPEVAKIVKKYDIGIVVESMDELIERWDEHEAKRINLYKCRDDLCMEKYTPDLEKLYQSLRK